jgi:hypothetical protein
VSYARAGIMIGQLSRQPRSYLAASAVTLS